MEHFQWIVGLTRVMSAVFRKGGDLTFLIEELEIACPESGSWSKIYTCRLIPTCAAG